MPLTICTCKFFQPTHSTQFLKNSSASLVLSFFTGLSVQVWLKSSLDWKQGRSQSHHWLSHGIVHWHGLPVHSLQFPHIFEKNKRIPFSKNNEDSTSPCSLLCWPKPFWNFFYMYWYKLISCPNYKSWIPADGHMESTPGGELHIHILYFMI